jgi:putative protein kinase ArgK-like GTPase of G3E family
LYLTLQLKKLGRPLVVALNMMDEILNHGDKLDIDRLAQLLQVPVVPISAKKGEGLDELIDTIYEAASPGCRRRLGRRRRHQGRYGCVCTDPTGPLTLRAPLIPIQLSRRTRSCTHSSPRPKRKQKRCITNRRRFMTRSCSTAISAEPFRVQTR